ncbi:ubiquitin carboxyl-terminal hydrolase 1-like [Phoenix dactylifera]|uniref:Ubiquitin carboxyl-terminal hydrolase 1-like n=1 Tax=Phoenix dactylifera TaxID=42345 RepID=A0A8B9B0N8_PHODC|nr:ubiquitin carboxyl-terminal hydrolase 1-like [Phoenix dactylifera]
MGMKTKAMARTPRRTRPRVFAFCYFSNSQPSNRNSDDGGERERCDHYKKDSAGLNLLLLEFHSTISIDIACEECFEEIRGSGIEENCQQLEKTDGEMTLDTVLGSRIIWVCLDCERYLCGGVEGGSEPHGHAHQHAMLEGHPWAARSDDPDVVWCFQCSSLVRIQMPGEGTEEAELMAKDEDVGCTGGVEPKKETDDGPKDLIIERRKAYVVRGLKNLGNTCFFNSVMQNLLAMDMFRDYILSSEWLVGPLTMEMKKLFVETTAAEDSALNPNSLFECICAKAPQFRGYQQQDSHELLRYLLDGLCTEEKNRASSVSSGGKDKTAANTGATFVETIFGGKLSTTISCAECGHTSTVYEPFLDLSLPMPAKKLPSENVPLAVSTRSKREGNGHERPGGEDVAKGSPVTKRQKFESFSPASECNESCIPLFEQAVSQAVQEVLMGIKFDGPTAVLEGADSASQMCDVSIVQYVENNSSGSSDSQTEICSKEIVTSLGFYGENSGREENLSSCIPDSGVTVLPYKKRVSTRTEINSMTQSQENVPFSSATVKECSAQSTSACSGPVDVDLGVFADIFDEPEITSDCKPGTATDEDTYFFLCANSESNQHEVDDTGGPLSVDSCLALFTETELLSDEHAWHCEQCSGNSLLHNLGYKRSQSQAGTSLDQSEALNSQVDGSEVRSKTASLSLEVDNEKMAVTPQNLVSNVERLVSARTTWDISQNALDCTGILDNKTCKHGQARNIKSSESLDPILDDQTQCDVSQKDENVAESNFTSQYLSCPAAQENSFFQESQGNLQSDSCSINDQIYVGCGRPAQPPASSCSRDHPETIFDTSCDNDSFSEINQIGKQGSQLPGKVNPTEDGRGHEMEPKSRKVKRDATIRVLISKAPPILTIHLKRFNQDANGHLNKLRGHVSFQEILDIRPYMDLRHAEKQCCYRLIGVVEHSGTMAGGHYVAYVRGERRQGMTKNAGSPAWFCASDDQVRGVSLSEVLQSEAYILFYEIQK